MPDWPGGRVGVRPCTPVTSGARLRHHRARMTTPSPSVLVLLPLAGALLVRWAPHRWSQVISLVVAWGGIGLVLPFWFAYDPRNPDFQFVERLGGLGTSHYVVGLDGLSVLFLLATAVLGVASTLLPPRVPAHRQRAWSATLLLAQAGVAGILIALDLLLFAVCWAATLASLARLAALGAGEAPDTGAAFRIASVLSAVAVLGGAAAVTVSDLTALDALSIPGGRQWWSFAAFVLAFGSTVPLFLMAAARKDRVAASWSVPGSVLLALGGYGLLRVNLPLLPEASRAAAPGLSLLAFAGVLAMGLRAWFESDARRLLVWLAAMLAALGMAGAFALHPDSIAGMAVQQAVRTMAVGALVLPCDAALRGAAPSGSGSPEGWSRRLAAVAASLVALATVSAGLWPRLMLAGAAAGGTAQMLALSAGAAFGALVACRFIWLLFMPQAQGTAGVAASPLALWLGALPAGAAVLAVVAVPAPVVDRVTVPALKIAARIDASYTGAFEAACDTTVTDAMKAANPANQFLTAAPCGPNGEPLPAGSSVPSTATPAR